LRLAFAFGLIVSGILCRQGKLLADPKLGLPMIVAGLAIGTHLAIDEFVAVSVMRKIFDSDKSVEYPKSYFDGVRFISESLVVASGVILGLIKDASFAGKSLPIASLGLGILIGIIHINILAGSLVSEYTVEKDDKVTSHVELNMFLDNLSSLLLNLQFMTFLIGLAAIATGLLQSTP
jgi:hypothetical protein